MTLAARVDRWYKSPYTTSKPVRVNPRINLDYSDVYMWETSDYAALKRVARVDQYCVAESNAWARVIGMLAGFFVYMCNQNNVSGIALSRDSKTVYIEITDASYSAIRETVNVYTDWLTANADIPYFDIELTTALSMQAPKERYMMTILPRR